MSSPLKIFVLGYGRSGTTMMGHILGNHPDVYMFRELNFFEKLWDRRQEQSLSVVEATDFAARLIGINQEGYGLLKDHTQYKEKGGKLVDSIAAKKLTPIRVYEEFLRHTVAENGKSIPCEQTPGYVFYVDEIVGLFPEAKIINMIRDPRDVLVSRKKKWRQYALRMKPVPLHRTIRTWVHYHPISISYLWKSAVKAAQPFVANGQIHQVKFEDLLAHPKQEIKKACDFIGISYLEAMLEIPVVGSSFLKEQPTEKGLDKTRTANWKHGGLNSAELYLNQRVTADIMKTFDYEPVKVFPNLILLLIYVIMLPVRMILTFVVHKRHFKNIKESMKRRLSQKSKATMKGI
jgi:hypothetical protein